jgi:integration host factor subunit beta
MTKNELIKKLMRRHKDLNIKDATRVVEIFFDTVTDSLVSGGRIELRGFGTISVKECKARIARNPSTNEKIMVSDRVMPYYRAGKELKERINS